MKDRLKVLLKNNTYAKIIIKETEAINLRVEEMVGVGGRVPGRSSGSKGEEKVIYIYFHKNIFKNHKIHLLKL